MKKEGYVNEDLKQSAAKLGLSHHFVFQHVNNPTHMSLLVKNALQKTEASVTKP